MTTPTLDLSALQRVWDERRRQLRSILGRIDVRGMTRPARDPVEREWLQDRGEDGPFIEDEAAGVAARAYYQRRYNR